MAPRATLRAASVAALAVSLAAVPLPGFAQGRSAIYACKDSSGRVTYQNVGGGSGCRRLDTDRSVSPPLPVPANSLPPGLPRLPEPGTRIDVQPAAFPRVDSSTQASRDIDRRRILSDELSVEEERLVRLTAERDRMVSGLRSTDPALVQHDKRSRELDADIARARANVAALQREIAGTSR